MQGPLPRHIPKKWVEGKDVEQRIKLYKFILHAQIASTILIVVGLILFILIIAGVI